MRFKPLFHALGVLLICLAVLMVPSLVVAIVYGGPDIIAFIYSILIAAFVGLVLHIGCRTNVHNLYAREGFAMVGLGWIVLSAFGMLPFLFSGTITSVYDAFFEMVSGFTTTGSSIVRDVEALPRGILFWRSFSHWVGGMGVLAFTIAVLPQIGLKNMEVLRAESPGPSPDKLTPKIRDTAKILYKIYLVMTLILFLLLMWAGLDWFHAATNTFGAAGTGGFSVLRESVGGYHNLAAEIILGIFMILFGVNFSLYFVLLTRKSLKAFFDEELGLYLLIIALAVAGITINIMNLPGVNGVWTGLRQAFFQVSTIITTTGYATTDFAKWPMFSQNILLFLMFFGACAGSTAGGFKMIRLLIAGKAARRELKTIQHTRLVSAVRVNGKPVAEETIRSIHIFIFLYVMLIIGALLVVSLDGFDFMTTFSAVITACGNVGPGLGLVGPAGSFADFSDLSKSVLSFCMLAGRLELLPILLLFKPSLWRRI